MIFNKNDRARIVGNNHSGHKFEIGSTVIVLIAEPESYKCRLEGGDVEWWVHPKDLGPIDQDSQDRILTLENDLAEWKRRVALLNCVLDYALGSVTNLEASRIHGYWDAMEAQS